MIIKNKEIEKMLMSIKAIRINHEYNEDWSYFRLWHPISLFLYLYVLIESVYCILYLSYMALREFILTQKKDKTLGNFLYIADCYIDMCTSSIAGNVNHIFGIYIK